MKDELSSVVGVALIREATPLKAGTVWSSLKLVKGTNYRTLWDTSGLGVVRTQWAFHGNLRRLVIPRKYDSKYAPSALRSTGCREERKLLQTDREKSIQS